MLFHFSGMRRDEHEGLRGLGQPAAGTWPARAGAPVAPRTPLTLRQDRVECPPSSDNSTGRRLPAALSLEGGQTPHHPQRG
ncbi:hypothetical protein A5623_15690 [Mycobacterium colombiense]|uniref:Uncharacterized protein n=1 Tax=Mycobacterium colombiense TaxID=339268 RepID=A0A853M1I5_9MYCO|nr:hypothetical protein A5623_15690 [Mycobacterium colombiense]OBJ60920.1 hypothetical protein A5628_07785 [Mycobacterium colombiense]